mgnify:CR=1 FL=1
MYYDYMLKFANSEECTAMLYTKEDYQGEVVLIPKYTAVDVIGVIYENQEDPDLPPIPYDGWHANVRNAEEAPELEAFRVYPPNPVRVWA